MSRFPAGLAVLVAVLSAPPASAIDAQWGDLSIKGVSKISLGAGWRTQDRHSNDLGILNTPGQQGLCQFDDCSSFDGNPAPNQRLLGAAGGFSFASNDDGDMN